MTDPFWLARAKTLPAGRSIKIECCASDKSLIITNDRKGYRGHCFRCGPAGFVPHGEFSIAEIQRRKAELAFLEERSIRLPADFTTDIPAAEATWLYKAGIRSDVAKHYGFGYSEKLRRVILPVYTDKKLIGFTARSTINERPKYIERFDPSSQGIFLADPALVLPSATDWATSCGPDLVIAEDILSTVRLGRCVRRAVSLLGTSASPEQLQQALGSGSPRRIALWLDGDEAGRRGSFKIERTLALMGYEVKRIRTPKDPKRYSNREIRSLLSLT
jgi:hypothetical protein